MTPTAVLAPAIPTALLVGMFASRAVVAVPAGERLATSWRAVLDAVRTPTGVATAVSFALGAVAVVLLTPAVYWAAAGWLVFLGVTLSAIDVRHHRLPDRLTLPGLPVLMLLLLLPAGVDGHWDAWIRALVGAALLWGLYYAGWLLAGMGYGDVKLAPTIGAITAWFGWEALAVGLVATLVLAVTAGAGVAGSKMARAPRGERWAALRSAPLPFGPAMFAGALVAAAWSEPILTWYMETFL